MYAPRFTVHDPEPVHAPLQATNVYPTGASALRETLPAAKRAEHVAPQSMPLGVEVTLPPSPKTVTCSAKLDGRRRKVAWNVWLLVNVVSQVVPSPRQGSTQSIQVMS